MKRQWGSRRDTSISVTGPRDRAQPVIPPNLYSVNVNEHNSLGSPGNILVNARLIARANC